MEINHFNGDGWISVSVKAYFTVLRTSPNGAVHERIEILAHDPDDARRIMGDDGWTVDSSSLSYHQPSGKGE